MDTIEDNFISPAKDLYSDFLDKDTQEDIRIVMALMECRHSEVNDLQVIYSHELPIENGDLFSIQEGDTSIGECIVPHKPRNSFWNNLLRCPCVCGFRVINEKVRFVVIASYGLGAYSMIFKK